LRTIGSGVRQFISLEEMKKDAFVLVFSNLKPRPLAGNMS
jgi:tRNA-binding EMAP/Myf-like protein